MDSSCFEGLLAGQIVKGDYDKLVNFYKANHPFLANFRLNSAGGDVDEAIRIGQLFRRYLITAWAPIRAPPAPPFLLKVCSGQGCVCASACALIWFGAVERHGSIGLHRPRTDDPAFKALSPADASALFRRMLDGVTRYLEGMEVPRPIIEAMVATSSAEIRWVDSEEDSTFKRPPSIAEWEDASCGSFTAEENNTYLGLMGATGSNKQLTQQEALLYKLLSERAIKKDQCDYVLMSTHRDQLLPP
jgi:hypothetical protein